MQSFKCYLITVLLCLCLCLERKSEIIQPVETLCEYGVLIGFLASNNFGDSFTRRDKVGLPQLIIDRFGFNFCAAEHGVP